MAADRASQTAAEHLGIATYASGLADLVDEFAPGLLAAMAWVEETRTGDGFQTDGEFAPTPGVTENQGLFERRLE